MAFSLAGLLEDAGIAAHRRSRVDAALFQTLVGAEQINLGWRLRLPASAPFWTQLRYHGAHRGLVGLVAMQLVQQALTVSGFWLIGREALDGQVEWGWLMAWGLLLFSAIPPRILGMWWQGHLTLQTSTLLKRRLLSGALHLSPEEVRRDGVGALLGRVMEADALEALVTGGGIATLMALIDVMVAGLTLAASPAAGAMLVSFCLVLLLVVVAGLVSAKRTLAWTASRLDLTHELIEKMVGHRTRLAQEQRGHWHLDEDERLADYADKASRLDRVTILLQSVAPRLWFVVGAASLAPTFLRSADVAGALAISVGGLLLGYRAFARVVAGLNALLRARCAWMKTAALFEAGKRQLEPGALSARDLLIDGDPTILEARDLRFAYPRRQEVLRGASMRIGPRDRVLLQGRSGGGKSTLGAVLAGLRVPTSGVLLLDGLDLRTVGEAEWRRRVAVVPQFHDNHLVGGTLAFNLLMGRNWPPSRDDLAEAEAVCSELGLGPLLARMPSGLMQIVGENGWQLSHGERSRAFLARALLQDARVLVLDETLAALDPETLGRSIDCVMKRARSLLVIAHP